MFAAGFWPKIPNFVIQAFLCHRNASEQKRLDEKRLRNGWMIGSHQPPTVVNRWRRGVGARVVLELTIVVASCGPLEPLPRAKKPPYFGHHISVSSRFDPFFHSYEVPGGR